MQDTLFFLGHDATCGGGCSEKRKQEHFFSPQLCVVVSDCEMDRFVCCARLFEKSEKKTTTRKRKKERERGKKNKLIQIKSLYSLFISRRDF